MTHTPRLVLVTGTSSGIGARLAETLAIGGWTVIGVARRAAPFEHKRYRHHRFDLGDLDALAPFVEDTLRDHLTDPRWERVGLVNNAGSPGKLQGLEQSNPSELASVFSVNAIAPTYLMAALARLVPAEVALRIVNVSSGAGVRGFPGLGDYGSSKAALRLATMVLAAELDSDERPGGRRHNFGILSYSPGPVDTEMQALARSPGQAMPWSRMFHEFAAAGRLLQPSQVTPPIVEFLSADEVAPFDERRYG